MGNIDCKILKKYRTIQNVVVDSSHKDFAVNRTLYLLPNGKINFAVNEKDKFISKNPELFFIEDVPYPIFHEKIDEKIDAGRDLKTLEDKVFENFIAQSAKTGGPGFGFLGAIKGVLGNKGIVFVLIIAGVIGWVVLNGGKII